MKKSISIPFGILLSILALLSPTISAQADEYWDQRFSLFDTLPIYPGDIVFLGNSITDGGEFNELFKMNNIKNRGIRSDNINGVKKRLAQVTKGHPKKIFLLIGVNDIPGTQTADQIAKRYASLVEEIRRQSPQTKLYLQSVMPINNSFKRYKSLTGKENTIKLLNKKIKDIAEKNHCIYIDLWPTLADATGRLKKHYTNDGLHLTGAGYRAWTSAIEKYVKE